MLKHRKLILLLSVFSVVALSLQTPQARGDEAESPEVGALLDALTRPPEWAKGDYDGLIERWADLLHPMQAHPLFELLVVRIREIFPFVTDPGFLEERYQELLKAGGLSPYNRELLREELGRMLLRAGKREDLKALELYEDRLTHWMLIGSFGFRSGTLHPIPFPPEEELDFEKSYPGFLGEVGWTPGTRLPDRPWVSPFRFLYPADGCVYGLCQFVIEEDPPVDEAVLQFETSASTKVWINDDLRLDAERLSRDYPARWFVPFPVRKGWNRILVKVSGASQALFSARILGAEGGELPVREETGATVRALGPPTGTGRVGDLGWEAGRYLDRRVSEESKNATLFAAAAIFATWQGLTSKALGLMQRACAVDSDPVLAFSLAKMTSGASHLPRDFRRRVAHQLLDRVLAAKPDVVPAVLMKARRLHADDRTEEAIALVSEWTGDRVEHFLPHRVLADFYEDLGWEKEWIEEMESASDMASGHPMIANAWAEYWVRKKNPLRALRSVEESLGTDASQDSLRQTRARLLRDLGRREEALEQLKSLLRRDPDRVEIAEELASMLRDLGHLDEAVALRRELVSDYPRYSAFKRGLADVLWLQGGEKRREAREVYEAAIDQSPGHHAVRDLIHHLDEMGNSSSSSELFDDEEVIFSLFQIDPLEVVRNAPGRREWPTASSLAVFDDVILRIYPDGSTRSETQQLFRIFDARGIEEHGTVRLDGEIIEVRTILPDGRVLEPITLSGNREFTMPGLTEGAFVHIRYFTRTPAVIGEPLRLPTFYFRDVEMKDPFVWSRYVVVHPEGMEVEVDAHDFGVEHEEFTLGKNKVYVFERKNMSAAKREKFMPDPRTIFPRVTIGQSRPEDEIASLFRRELLQRVRPTEELRRAAAEVTRGLKDDREKVEALYRFVRGHVQNEAGSSEATAVLVTREGSRLFLFLGLFRALDLPFEYGRARPAPDLDEEVNWELVDVQLFPERVVRVLPESQSGEQLFVSDDFELPFGQISTVLRGGPVIWITPRGARREWLSEIPEEERVSQSTLTVLKPTADPLGFEVSISTSIPNVDGYGLKSRVATMVENRRRFIGLAAINSRFPGGIFQSMSFPGIEAPTEPFRFDVRGTLPFSSLERLEGARSLRVPFEPLRLSEAFASGQDRRHPIHFLQYDRRRAKLEVELGGLFSVRRLPPDLRLNCGLGSYEMSFRREGDRVVAERVLDFRPTRLGAASYRDLMDFCRAVDEKEKESLLLEARPRTDGNGNGNGGSGQR